MLPAFDEGRKAYFDCKFKGIEQPVPYARDTREYCAFMAGWCQAKLFGNGAIDNEMF